MQKDEALMSETDEKLEAIRGKLLENIEATYEQNAQLKVLTHTCNMLMETTKKQSDLIASSQQSDALRFSALEKMHAEVCVAVQACDVRSSSNKDKIDKLLDTISKFKLNIFKLLWYALILGILVMLQDGKNLVEWLKLLLGKFIAVIGHR